MDHARSIRLLAVAAALTTLTACSGSEDVSPPTTLSPTTTVTTTVPETVPTTTEPAPTTAPPTTEPVSTTEPTVPPTTTAPATSDVPPTTSETIRPRPDDLASEAPPRVTFPDDPELQAVVDGFYAYQDALFASFVDPTDEALRGEVLQTTGEPQSTRVAAVLDRLATEGQAARQPEGTVSYAEVLTPSVFARDGLATLDACLVDTALLVEVGSGAGGADVVLNNVVSSVSDTYSFELVGERWVVVNIERFSRFEDQVGCG